MRNGLFFLFTCLILSAASAHAETDELRRALGSAYESNPRVTAERNTLAAVDEQVNQALSGWMPQVNANLDKGRQRNRLNNAPFHYSDEQSEQLAVVQPLFNGGGTVAQTKAAKALVKAERAQLMAVEQQVLYDAVSAYVGVVQGEAVLDLAKKNRDALDEEFKGAKDRFDVGEVTKTDVAQAQSRQATSLSNVTQAQGDLESARATFTRVIGYAPPAGLAVPPNLPEIPATLDEALNYAIEHNPELERSRFIQKSAEGDVDSQISTILPNLSLQGVLNRDKNADLLGQNDQSSDALLLNLHVPIYQGGAEYSRVRQSKQTLLRRKFESIDSGQAVREQVTQAWQQYNTAKALVVSNQEAIKSAELALEGVSEEHKFGSRTTLDVLDTERDLFQARVNFVRSQSNEVLSRFLLLQTMGKLNPSSLGLQTVEYDPKKHYNRVEYKIIGF